MNSFRSSRYSLRRWWPYARRPGYFFLALVLGLGFYWLQLSNSHQRMREQVTVDTQRLAGQTGHALALQMSTVVRKLDYFSRHLSWAWLQGNTDTFHDASGVAIDTLTSETLVQIAVADAEGRILYSSLNWGAPETQSQPAVSIADREYFRVHLDAAGPALFISDPIKGRISQKWTIQFTRGLFKDGEFIGVMILAVSAEHLAASLKAIFPDPDDAASLLKNDGTYLARSYYLDEVLGKALPPSRPFIQHPERVAGTYEIPGMIDDMQRFYSWRRIEDYPLVILVGLSSDKAMALLRKSIKDSYWQSATGSVLLLLAGLSLVLLWTQRSIRATDLQNVADALKVETSRLNTMLERFPGGVRLLDTDGHVIFSNALWAELQDPQVAAWLASSQTKEQRDHQTHEICTEHGRFLEIDNMPIRQDEQYQGALWLLRDITDRKQHELKLTELASTDPLTGLPNRRSFTHALNAMYASLLQGKLSSGVVMMLDIDHFKKVNDTYGHATGDVVLKHIAQVICAAVRASDLPGRYGGEEFVVLQAQISLEEGRATAERIRRKVEGSAIEVDGMQIAVTISVGLCLLDAAHPPDLALQRADQALYAAKNSGRNKVCVSGGLSPLG